MQCIVQLLSKNPPKNWTATSLRINISVEFCSLNFYNSIYNCIYITALNSIYLNFFSIQFCWSLSWEHNHSQRSGKLKALPIPQQTPHVPLVVWTAPWHAVPHQQSCQHRYHVNLFVEMPWPQECFNCEPHTMWLPKQVWSSFYKSMGYVSRRPSCGQWNSRSLRNLDHDTIQHHDIFTGLLANCAFRFSNFNSLIYVYVSVSFRLRGMICFCLGKRETSKFNVWEKCNANGEISVVNWNV